MRFRESGVLLPCFVIGRNAHAAIMVRDDIHANRQAWEAFYPAKRCKFCSYMARLYFPICLHVCAICHMLIPELGWRCPILGIVQLIIMCDAHQASSRVRYPSLPP
jgi:hypothetical protein